MPVLAVLQEILVALGGLAFVSLLLFLFVLVARFLAPRVLGQGRRLQPGLNGDPPERVTVDVMTDQEAINALVGDLQWQIDQMRERRIKNNAGHQYNPSFYKRGLEDAIEAGGNAVRST